MRPSDTDSLPVGPQDPPGWHVRERTLHGYPVVGSSPAEREERVQRAARIKQQAMRDHAFYPSERDARFCGWTSVEVLKDTRYGSWAFRSECGYPPDTHPVEPMSTPVSSHGGAGEGSPMSTPVSSHGGAGEGSPMDEVSPVIGHLGADPGHGGLTTHRGSREQCPAPDCGPEGDLR